MHCGCPAILLALGSPPVVVSRRGPSIVLGRLRPTVVVRWLRPGLVVSGHSSQRPVSVCHIGLEVSAERAASGGGSRAGPKERTASRVVKLVFGGTLVALQRHRS